MLITETRRGALLHVLLCGDVDGHEAAILSDALHGHIEAGDTRILLEFGNRCFASSALIGILIMLQRLADAAGGGLTLVRPPRILRRSLLTLGAGGLFRIEESVAAALRPAEAAAR